jgi:hypothetical protein
MQKFLAHPVSTPFFFIFGLVLSQAGYAGLKRGSFQYTPEHGPAQIISPATNGSVYWAVTGGMLAVGALLIAIGAYAAVCLFRACCVPEGADERPRFGMFTFAFAIFIIVFALITSMRTRQ